MAENLNSHFWAVIVTYTYNGDTFHSVGLVYAEDWASAWKKGNVLYQPYSVISMELKSLENEHMERIKTAYGGYTIANFELEPE